MIGWILMENIMLKMKDKHYTNNIAELRNKKDISQTQLANAIGVETSTISRIETGKSDPSAVTLFAVAKYLQVSVNDLYARKTTEQIKNEREQEFFKRNIRYYVSTIESKKNPWSEHIFEIWRMCYRKSELFSL